jgi:hypothetical protein
MKKSVWVLIACFTVFPAGFAFAGETGHYVSGIDEFFVAPVPPGFYYRLYNVFYTASEMTDKNGNDRNLDYDINTYSFINRFYWTPDIKILGAGYTADIMIPLIFRDIEIGKARIRDNESGLGDIYLEPMALSWSGSCYNAVFSMGVFLPTGDYDKNNPASPGKDFYTYLTGLGATWNTDMEKKWSVSLRAKYETHSYKRETDVRPGDDFHLETRISRRFFRIFDAGVLGYWHSQVTDDRGKDIAGDKSIHDSVYAAGPEIKLFLPKSGLVFAFRNLWEFEAKDRNEGVIFTLTLTKTF